MTGLPTLSLLSLLSVPAFLALLGLEVVWARRHRVRYHILRETVASLACGAGEQAVALLLTVPLLAVYVGVARFAPHPMSATSVWTWIVAAVAIDFLYYWFHRAGHRIGFIWAIHVVHHQSRDFNFSVALRNSFFGKAVQLVFVLPLAIAGVPVVVIVVEKTLMNFYMFWQHTQTVGRLDRIEGVLVTPSSHRVHHALNERFQYCNYGGVLAVWDRLFGTFREEDEPCVFDAVPDFPGFDPVLANVAGWAVLGRRIRRAGSWREAFRVAFGPPVSTPPGDAWPAAARPRPSAEFPPAWDRQAYAYVQMVAALTGLAIGHTALPRGAVLLAMVSVLAGLVVPTALLDRRSWAPTAERVRLCGLLLTAVVAVVIVGPAVMPAALALGVWSLASLVVLARTREQPAVDLVRCE